MSAPDSTVMQFNFKTPSGGLHNIYAESVAEATTLLAEFQAEVVAAIYETEMKINAAYAVASPSSTPTLPGAAKAAPAAAATAAPTGDVPLGPDGTPRIAKSGVSAKGPWKAWMTSARKGEPGYAEPIWIRRGSPEWDTHPA